MDGSRHTEHSVNRSARIWWTTWSVLLGLAVLLRALLGSTSLHAFRGVVEVLYRVCWQFGGLGGLVTLVAVGLATARRRDVHRAVRGANAKLVSVLLGCAVALAIGEGVLRVVFHDGLTFGVSRGPLAVRFAARHYNLNQFQSRGPDAIGPREQGSVRILVQGDSITFGQGLKDERDVYPTRLLAHLDAQWPNRFEMAVIAIPGYEIDDHLDRLRTYGEAVEPDVILYQWHKNDVEVDKTGRPTVQALWEQFAFHQILSKRSYAWFFADERLRHLLRYSDYDAYRQYYMATYAPTAAGWHRFAEVFGEWARRAKQLTPRVLVMLHATPLKEGAVGRWNDAIYEALIQLCHSHGIVVVDMREELADMEYSEELRVSRFDGHPSAILHARMAGALAETIYARWPQLMGERR